LLFNSYAFILCFLPLTLVVLASLNRKGWASQAKSGLVLLSLVFYGFWDWRALPVLLFSMMFNHWAAVRIGAADGPARRRLLVLGLAVNLLTLGFFKYADFFLANLGALAGSRLAPLGIAAPLGISFYTFMQIAYLADVYRGTDRPGSLAEDGLFGSFFPYIASGPIVRHGALVSQFKGPAGLRIAPENLARGLFLFSLGLFKKTALADNLALVAAGGFDTAAPLNFMEAWITSLSYTFQLYFDFSGYTDMALGAALMLGVTLPANFLSPYKAVSLRDFWRRWHITLSTFLRDYLYIPLGGNRKGEARTYGNLLVTFLLCGLWHGAAWTFVFWGFLHGAGMVVQRLWERTGIRLSRGLAWLVTFNFVNVAWIFFRAREWEDALRVLGGMCGLNGLVLSKNLAETPVIRDLAALGVRFGQWHEHLPKAPTYLYLLCVAAIPFCLLARNSNELAERFAPTWKTAALFALFMAWGLLSLNRVSVFLYFNF
jgi:D-alanyl-lipoteichoic acid acyltransferase DltB (MBOAT superfamily)